MPQADKTTNVLSKERAGRPKLVIRPITLEQMRYIPYKRPGTVKCPSNNAGKLPSQPVNSTEVANALPLAFC